MAATGAIAALKQRKREIEEKKLKLLEQQLCLKYKKVFADIFEESQK